jgi:type IV pilus assembly protein PilA
MFARIRKAMEEREEGFTLIELLVVIIIIGILAAIAIPVFLSQRQKGYDAAVKSDVRNLATAEESYLTSNPTTYANAGQLVSSNLISAISNGDTVAVYYDAAQGYCLVGTNTNHSGTFYVYNSLLGGLQSGTVSTSAVGSCTLPSSATGAWVGPSYLTQLNSTLSTS